MSRELELMEDKNGNILQQCTSCGKWLIADETNFYKDDTTTGLKGKCKECCKKYYKDNRYFRLKYQNNYNREVKNKINLKLNKEKINA